jgi:hypothetical protein
VNAVKPETHCGRVLAALSDGKWHTTRSLYREAGPLILHSRIADLRRKGYRIECEHIAGKGSGAGAYRYQWLDAPAPDVRDDGQLKISTDEIAPRVEAERYRIFRTRNGGAPEIVATVGTLEAIGPALYLLGTEGEFDDYCVGLQDALDHQDENGKWVGKWFLLPWQKGI